MKKSNAEKLQASMKYLQEFGRQGNSITYFFDYTTLSINKTHGQKAASSSSLRNVTSESQRDITITAIAAKVYNALLFNIITPEIVEKIIGKNQNGFRKNRPTTSHIIEGVRAKRNQGNTIVCRFLLGI